MPRTCVTFHAAEDSGRLRRINASTESHHHFRLIYAEPSSRHTAQVSEKKLGSVAKAAETDVSLVDRADGQLRDESPDRHCDVVAEASPRETRPAIQGEAEVWRDHPCIDMSDVAIEMMRCPGPRRLVSVHITNRLAITQLQHTGHVPQSISTEALRKVRSCHL
jgi:hypothetical protein